MKKLLLLVFVVVVLLVSCESDYDRILKSNHIEINFQTYPPIAWEIDCPDGKIRKSDGFFTSADFVMTAELGKEYTFKVTSYELVSGEFKSHCEITVKTDTRRTYVIVKENETDQLFCKVYHL